MWKSINTHPLTGILIWIAYKPNCADFPSLIMLDIARYDSWQNMFRFIKNGEFVPFPLAWQKCETPTKPTQIEIDKKFGE